MKTIPVFNQNGEPNRNIKPGDIVQHFKGGIYLIKEIARHTETGEQLVIYESLDKRQIWARPLDMFMSKIDYVKYPDAYLKQKFRMIKIDLVLEDN